MPFQALTAAKIAQVAVGTATAPPATIYITPPNTQTYVKDICICNTAATKLNINLYLVPKNRSAGIAAPFANALFYNLDIDSHTTTHWTGVQILNEGDTIQASASAAGLVITISGAQAV